MEEPGKVISTIRIPSVSDVRVIMRIAQTESFLLHNGLVAVVCRTDVSFGFKVGSILLRNK